MTHSVSDERLQIRNARKNFIAMAATYFCSVFNDNFFKQSVLLLAVSAGRNDAQGLATMIFTLPYLIVTAPAGWLADRFSKRNVVICVKVLELIAMIIGALGMLLLKPGDSLSSFSWLLILTMLALMGIHASLFSPSLNGSIPELYPESYVTQANGIVKLVCTLAILCGIALAGFALDSQSTSAIITWFQHIFPAPVGQCVVALTVLSVAVFGLLVSFGVPKRKAAGTRDSFPWFGPVNTVRDLLKIREDSLLHISVWANTFFWFMGSLMVLIINEMGPMQFNLNKTSTSVLVVAEMLGVGVGALLAARFAKGEKWYRVLLPTLFMMTLFLLLMSCIIYMPSFKFREFSFQVMVLFLLLVLFGVCSGLYLIPLESFIQIRPSADQKGKVIAASNFAALMGVFVAGPLYWILAKLNLKPTQSFMVLAGISGLYGWKLFLSLKRAGLTHK
ncbi:MAG: MFS transporter [Candidatus Aureabacteria bacterium]|nr:MFS transporter [Candidatus Auribacterota bacterium]